MQLSLDVESVNCYVINELHNCCMIELFGRMKVRWRLSDFQFILYELVALKLIYKLAIGSGIIGR
jgi:hypothetical protein